MNERLSLQDLIDVLAKKQDITKKESEMFLRELIAVISENIESNEPVKIKDFGVFKLVKVNARKSVDVNTGEAIEIPAHYKLSFTPDKSLKDAINRPFAHFESVILEEGISFENTEKEDIGEVKESDIDTSDSVAVEENTGPIIENTTSSEPVEIDLTEEVSEVQNEEPVVTENESHEEESVEEKAEPKLQQPTAVELQEESTEALEEEVSQQEPVGIVAESEELPEQQNVESEEPKKDEEEIAETVTPEDNAVVEKEVVITEPETEVLAEQDVPEVEEEQITEYIHTEEKKETPPAKVEQPQTSYSKAVSAYTEPEPDFLEEHIQQQRKRKLIIGGAIGLFAVALLIIGVIFFQDISRYITGGSKEQDSKEVYDFRESQSGNTASTPVDSLSSTTTTANQGGESVSSTANEPTQNVQPASTEPLGVVEIKKGDTLRNIAYTYYRNKAFWVYIFEENKKVIPNPNNVPIGTKLVIPAPSKYGIDAENRVVVEKAQKMEKEIFAKFQ